MEPEIEEIINDVIVTVGTGDEIGITLPYNPLDMIRLLFKDTVIVKRRNIKHKIMGRRSRSNAETPSRTITKRFPPKEYSVDSEELHNIDFSSGEYMCCTDTLYADVAYNHSEKEDGKDWLEMDNVAYDTYIDDHIIRNVCCSGEITICVDFPSVNEIRLLKDLMDHLSLDGRLPDSSKIKRSIKRCECT